MPDIIAERVSAEVEHDIVLFLIGMRINKLWKVWQWLPVARAMNAMLAELAARPDLGLLAHRVNFAGRNLSATQYWKSAAHLDAFAHSPDFAHLPAWKAFHRNVGKSGDVGIWHETYVVPHTSLETIYLNMPRHGLGLVGTLFPSQGNRATAAKRLTRSAPDAPHCNRPVT